jgi:predicted type IV restriction endonuclease
MSASPTGIASSLSLLAMTAIGSPRIRRHIEEFAARNAQRQNDHQKKDFLISLQPKDRT